MTTDHDKQLATLQARCALIGAALTTSDDDHGQPLYIVSRWALTRALPSLDAVEQWLNTYEVKL
jgi:hypothetical protein